MRLGLIARADNSGLGIQTLGFYKHMKPEKTLVVDISDLNGNKVYPERYPDRSKVVHGFPNDGEIREFLDGLDVVFTAEAAYNPRLYTIAREMGVKTANQYNYEFFDWIPNPDLPKPDMFIAPSLWHYEEVERFCNHYGIVHAYLHCPVDRDDLPFRKITRFRTFLHQAGRSAAHDRNGTETVIRASQLLKSDAKILIHFQGEQGLAHQTTRTVREYMEYADTYGNPRKLSIIQYDYKDYRDAYTEGNALVLPRRYGGNCLPVNEALSVGMPVLMPDISPNNEFLPRQWLVDATKLSEFTPRTQIDIFDVSPADLAFKIDELATYSMSQAAEENFKADAIAQSVSWDVMAPRYKRVLEALCTR